MAPRYKAGGLFATHWPTWDIHSKAAEVVDQWDWIQSVHFKTGDYNDKLDAFPVMVTKHANSNMATMTTHIYSYKILSILHHLNCKMVWHQVALTMPQPMLKHNADEEQRLTHKMHLTHYEVWTDGAMRNIIYLNSIHESFFEWIEKQFYRNKNATGKLLNMKKMGRDKHCVMLKNWMMHELVIQVHVPNQLDPFMADKLNRKKWRAMTDIFKLGEYIYLSQPKHLFIDIS